jgi:hypothetical protein
VDSFTRSEGGNCRALEVCSTLDTVLAPTPARFALVFGILALLFTVAGAALIHTSGAAGPVRAAAPVASVASAVEAGGDEDLLAGAIFIQTIRGPGWQVIQQYSAHDVLIVKVRTDRIDAIAEISPNVIEGLKGLYDEVLVYFYRPHTIRILASARVQWTPAGGYEYINYEELEQTAAPEL